MRLAIYHNHPSGGAARAIHELGSELSRRHDITVFTLATSAEHFLSSARFATDVRTYAFSPHTPVRFGAYYNDVRRRRDLDRLGDAQRMIAKDIDAGGFDVVLVSVCRFTHAPAVLSYLRTPALYFCHEPPRRYLDEACSPGAGSLDPYERVRRIWRGPAERWIDREVQRRDRANVAAATSVITNSSFTAGSIRSYYGREASVSYLGVDTAKFVPGEPNEPAYVVTVGAVEPHKEHDFLIRAVGLLPPSLRPRLVIIANDGNPRWQAHLVRLAAERRVNVELRVGVPERELIAWYQAARAFMYAPHAEPFGLATLEAMACGKPVIAVSEGGIPEVVRDGSTGVLVRRDELAFADALASILAEPSRARALGEAARCAVEGEWSWDAAATRLEQHLSALLPVAPTRCRHALVQASRPLEVEA